MVNHIPMRPRIMGRSLNRPWTFHGPIWHHVEVERAQSWPGYLTPAEVRRRGDLARQRQTDDYRSDMLRAHTPGARAVPKSLGLGRQKAKTSVYQGDQCTETRPSHSSGVIAVVQWLRVDARHLRTRGEMDGMLPMDRVVRLDGDAFRALTRQSATYIVIRVPVYRSAAW